MTKADGITRMAQTNGMTLMTQTNVFRFRSRVHILSLTYWQIRREISVFYNGNVIFVISLRVCEVSTRIVN
jgi:hypothetical protein